jgi:hypothetical protein
LKLKIAVPSGGFAFSCTSGIVVFMNLMLPKVDIAFKLLFGDQRSRNILSLTT